MLWQLATVLQMRRGFVDDSYSERRESCEKLPSICSRVFRQQAYTSGFPK